MSLLQDKINQHLSRYRQDESYRKLILSGFYSFLIRIVGIGTGFLVMLITSRFFGADALGIVSICMAILSFAAIFGKLGMDVALMRYIAGFSFKKDFSAVKKIYLTGWRFILPTGILITAFLYFSASFFAEHIFHKPDLKQTLQLNALFVLPLITLLINSEAIRGVEKIKTYTFLQTSAVSVLATISLLAAICFSTGKYIPVYIQFGSITIAAIISKVMWLKYSHWFDASPTPPKEGLEILPEKIGKVLIRTSSPMFTTTIMQLIASWAGVLIMASYYSEAETGVFNAIVRTSTFVNITIHAINSIASPRFAAAYSSGRLDELKKFSRESTRMIFISSLPLFFVLFLFPHFVLSVFGKDFTGHETSLMILLIGQLLVSFSGLASQILNMADREKLLRNIAIVTAIVNVAFCFILIPPYGVLGGAIAQVAGMLTWNVLCIISVRKEFHFNTFFSFKSNAQ